MATYRPVILQHLLPANSLQVAVPFKDGVTLGGGAVTEAQPGSYTPTNWPYRALGVDPNAGVELSVSMYS